jgi:Zn-dependent protease
LLHTIQLILLVAPVLLFSVIAHEIAHGYAALWQGDRTALDAGRLTWNPAKHIDLFLTIILPIVTLGGSFIAGGRAFVLGGAKPVPVDPRNYRNPKLGDIAVSLAGVFTNLLVAIGCALLIVLSGVLGRQVPALDTTIGIFQAMLRIGIGLNAVLIAFNLLPIPPLDGSHVFKYLLPQPVARAYLRFGPYGLLLLVVLLYAGAPVLEWWIGPALSAAQWMLDLVQGYLLPSAAQWLP